MTNRPEPRKSSAFAGRSPVTEQQQAPPAASDTAKQAKHGKWDHKVSFYQDRNDTNRLRAAILATQHHEGPRSMSEFIDRAVMVEVERLEHTYNDGQPFNPVNTFPHGATIKQR